MSLVTILILVLVAIGLGVWVGSFWTFLLYVLIGVAVALVFLAGSGGIFARRHPVHREDGAPLRRSQL